MITFNNVPSPVHKSTVSRLVRDPLVLQEVRRLQDMADVHAAACVPGIPEKIREGAQKGALLDDGFIIEEISRQKGINRKQFKDTWLFKELLIRNYLLSQ